MDPAVDPAAQQAGGFQHSKMLGDGGKRDSKGRGELGNGGCALRQASQDGTTGGIGESAEGGVKRGQGARRWNS
jgi:hypothetical protein